MMVSVIELASGRRVAEGALPLRFVLPAIEEGQPDNGITEFVSIGQEAPEHGPLYRCVGQFIATPEPAYPWVKANETRTYANDRDEITRTYAPDQSAYQREIERLIETTATSRGYSSTVSLASYATSTIPQWKAEADAFIAWRDAVWLKALTELGKVQQGEREPPVLEAFMEELPAMVWPQA